MIFDINLQLGGDLLRAEGEYYDEVGDAQVYVWLE